MAAFSFCWRHCNPEIPRGPPALVSRSGDKLTKAFELGKDRVEGRGPHERPAPPPPAQPDAGPGLRPALRPESPVNRRHQPLEKLGLIRALSAVAVAEKRLRLPGEDQDHRRESSTDHCRLDQVCQAEIQPL